MSLMQSNKITAELVSSKAFYNHKVRKTLSNWQYNKYSESKFIKEMVALGHDEQFVVDGIECDYFHTNCSELYVKL